VVISIEEERPKAIFLQDNVYYYITYNGDIIDEAHDIDDTKTYLIVKGKDANLNFSALLDEVYTSERIYSQIDILEQIENRRWNITLKNGTMLKLPERNISQALQELEKLLADNDFLFVCKMVDLRFMPNKIYAKF